MPIFGFEITFLKIPISKFSSNNFVNLKSLLIQLSMDIEHSEKHIKLWNIEKNGFELSGIGLNNRTKKYWWKCECGHNWEAYIQSITRKKESRCNRCNTGFMDFSGQTFNKWEVIRKANSNECPINSGAYWLCKCLSCNKEKVINGSYLKNDKQCQDCYIKSISLGWPIAPDHWKNYKNGAWKRGLKFEIDVDYAYNLFIKQDKKCTLTGDDLILYDNSIKWKKESPAIANYASLDRIDSSLGYVEGNVQWVRKDINIFKSNWNQATFINWCKMVAQHC